MKAVLVTILVFGIVIASVVVYSVHFGEDQARNELRQTAKMDLPAAPIAPVVAPAPVAPPPSPAPAEPEEPEQKEEPKPQVIYVPQIIERVYVKEIIHTRVVIREPERTHEPAVYEPRYSNNQGGYDHERTSSMNDDRCASFTGEARDRCNQLIRCAGNRCDRYVGTLNYYPCLKYYGG